MMDEYSDWERAADLLGLIHAVSFLVDDAKAYPTAQHGLSAVLSVAQRLAEDVCEKAERADRSAGQVVIDER